MRPYYQDDAVTIYHGDCRDVLPELPPAVDVVFTSPPYNLGNTSGGGFDRRIGNYSPETGLSGRGGGGKWNGGALAHGYGAHGDDMPHDEYVAWQHDVLRLCWGTLSERGAIFYNHKQRVFNGLAVLPTAYNPGLPLRQVIVWARAGGINFTTTHYCPTHEWLLLLAKPAFRLKSKGASGVGDVWRVTQESGSLHPAPFPIGLPARAIESTGPSLVLDPFAGSGTTLRAAKDAGVRSIGIELEERWCEHAAERCAQEVLDFGSAA